MDKIVDPWVLGTTQKGLDAIRRARLQRERNARDRKTLARRGWGK